MLVVVTLQTQSLALLAFLRRCIGSIGTVHCTIYLQILFKSIYLLLCGLSNPVDAVNSNVQIERPLNSFVEKILYANDFLVDKIGLLR